MKYMLTLFPTEIEYELLFVCICANVNKLKYIAIDRTCNNKISIARSQKKYDRLKNLDPILLHIFISEHEPWTLNTQIFNIMNICVRSFFSSYFNTV